MSHIKLHGVKPRIQYVADGTLKSYEFPFVIFTESDIQVYFNDTLQEPTTYTVTGIKNTDGGSITFTKTPSSGTIITITRDLSIERTTDFQDGGALRADTLNDEFDYQTACLQQVADNLNRSMILPPYAADTNVNLTLPTPAAGKAIVWNNDGTNLENSAVKVNELENTLREYKETAESASAKAVSSANTATEQALNATNQAQIAVTKAAETAGALNNKLNIQADNLSQTGKSNLINLTCPDHTKAIAITTTKNGTFTVPSDGYLLLSLYAYTSIGLLCYSSSIATCMTNIYGIKTHASDDGRQATMFRVQKGEVLTCTLSAGDTKEAYYIPMKGVN